MKHLLLFAAPLALLAACSEAPISEGNIVNAALPENVAEPALLNDSLPEETPAADNEADPAGAGNAVGSTKGGDGSDIALTALESNDIEALSGELACGFRLADQRQPMLFGRANVGDDEPATVAIRHGGYVERLSLRGTGGFNAMERGGIFSGRGMTLTIERGARQGGAAESPDYAATLLAQRADGAERRYQGLWTCGP